MSTSFCFGSAETVATKADAMMIEAFIVEASDNVSQG